MLDFLLLHLRGDARETRLVDEAKPRGGGLKIRRTRGFDSWRNG